MTKRENRVRKNVEEAVAAIGGTAWTAARCGVSQQAVKNWLHAGQLNQAYAINAWRLARAVKRPLADFLSVD